LKKISKIALLTIADMVDEVNEQLGIAPTGEDIEFVV